MTQYMGVKIDETRDKLLSEQANKLLKDYYCQETYLLTNIIKYFMLHSFISG